MRCSHAERPAQWRGALGDEVVVPDRHGTGTNGLLLTPPDAIAPSFGPGSCERHRALARAAGARLPDASDPHRCCSTSTPARTCAALRERLDGKHLGAPRTRAVLGDSPTSAHGLPITTTA